ncbi:MAG: hypothetical protein MUP49_07290 [Dehalococcoidia bacterium]|nr:hypothetical protein [Dehalococcoidia bacterium]
MPKSEPVLLLPVFMAIGPLQGVTQKRLFGGQYVRAGDFVAILGTLYESCALLGRMFKDDVASLGQLLQVKPGNEGEFMAFVKEKAAERLGRYRLIYGSDPDSLVFLVLATDYGKVGLVFPHGNVGSIDDFKRLGRAAQGKVDIKNKNVWRRLEMTLGEGIGFGLRYPELTWDLVSRQHEPVDLENEGWKRFRSAGFAIPERLATDSAEQAETLVLDLVRGYVQKFRPELTETLDLLNRGGLPEDL